MAMANAALKCAISIVALGAVGLGSGLTLAVTLEGDSDGQGVLKTYRFDDEGFLLLFGAPTCTGLHTEGDLQEMKITIIKHCWLTDVLLSV